MIRRYSGLLPPRLTNLQVLIVDAADPAIRAALDGVGLAFASENPVTAPTLSGSLVFRSLATKMRPRR